MAIPKKGEVIERRGKKYEVRSVQPVIGNVPNVYRAVDEHDVTFRLLLGRGILTSDRLWTEA